jgi:hypothetical protein
MSVDIDRLFQELQERCKSKDVYSVREIAARMGINYDYIELCAAQDEGKNETLQMCRSHCACNAIEAGLRGNLSIRELNKYWIENEDEYAREWGHEQIFEDERDPMPN